MSKVSTLQLQQQINRARTIPPIDEDGLWGRQTREAVIEVFRNARAPAASPAEIGMIADAMGVPRVKLQTVAIVEAGKAGGWDDHGLLTALWERHYAWRRIRYAIPFLSDPKPGGYTLDADKDGICDSWEHLADLTGKVGFPIAAECASFGKFQITGAHWKALGYSSVWDFIWQLSRTELAHYRAFAMFIRVNGLLPALHKIDGNPQNCTAFARGYNGKGQQGYDVKIAATYRRLTQ